MTSNNSSRIGAAPPTLDQLLRQNAQRGGDTLALIDAPDRPLWADGAPRRMSWNQVDAAVSAVAGRFFEMGLPSEAVVCIQGLNVTDTLIGLLGCIRAGLVAMIVPMDYSASEIVGVAERLNAKAILSTRKIGQEQPLRSLRHLVDESIADIRFIGAFGPDLPGGTVSFEDCIGYPKTGVITRLSRRERPEDSLAIMTVDGGPDGAFVLARNHREWHAAASIVVDALGLSRQSRLLSPMTPTSLAGLASGMVAWLMAGCQLILHQAFDATVFGVQMTMHGVTHVVLPEPALQAGLSEGIFGSKKLEKIASLTREPRSSIVSSQAPCPVLYFAVLGEIGIVPMNAKHDGRFRLVSQIVAGDGQPPVLETLIEKSGYLALRGDQVPVVGFDISDRDASYPLSPEDWVTTDYPAVAADDGVQILGRRYAQVEGHAAQGTLAPSVSIQSVPDAEGTPPRALAGAA
jgi:acyl-CoA synthetase (AMP-forming)/AMP-acid ligase II